MNAIPFARRFSTNFVDHLRVLARDRPDDSALIVVRDCEGVTVDTVLTYSMLDRRARALAAHLQRKFTRGDRVLLLLDNDEYYVIAFFACLYAGLIAVPVFPPESTRPQHLARLVGIAQDSRANGVLITGAFAPIIDSLIRDFAGIASVAVDTIDEDMAGVWVPHQPDLDDIAFLQYTSGSTASPKGVMVSHGNLMANERAIEKALAVEADDVFVSWLPLYHDMGLIGGLLQPVHRGIPAVLMTPQFFLEKPLRWLETISRLGGTISGGPDFSYRLCVERIGEQQRQRLDLSRWRLAFSGAEPVRRDTLDDFVGAFAVAGFSPSAVFPCYGLAEATLLVTSSAVNRGVVSSVFSTAALAQGRADIAERGEAGSELVSCGVVADGHAIRIVDPDSKALLDHGRLGEIWVSGPSVAAGYWEKPDVTAAVFVEHEGARWLRTGDVGLSFDGHLYIAGRLKDLIIVRGHNLYPQDIERNIEAEIDVVRKGRVAAFAVDGEDGEGIGVAVELSRSAQKLVPAEKLAALIGTVVAAQCGEAASVVVLLNPGALPKTSSGKLQRNVCRTQWGTGALDAYATFVRGALQGRGETRAAGEVPDSVEESADAQAEDQAALDEIAVSLANLWREILKIGDSIRLAPDSNFFLCGGNSLRAVQLAARIGEQWRIEMPVRALFDRASLAGMARAIGQRYEKGQRCESGAPAAVPRLASADDAVPARLSPMQERLWFLWQLDPASTAYHIGGTLRIDNTLSIAALQEAVDRLVARHESLRTRFVAADDGSIRQYIEPARAGVLTVIDQRQHAVEDIPAAEQETIARISAEPFDLTRDALLRAVLIRKADAKYALVLVMHHIIADGLSLQIVIDELAALYATPHAVLPLLPLSYGDYAEWQHRWLAAGAAKKQLDWWRGQLGPDHPVLTLPTDHRRAPQAQYRAARHRFSVGDELLPGLSLRAEAGQTTLFAVLFAALQMVLYRYTGQSDIRIGVPVANRRQPEIQQLVGFFVNTLVLPARIDGRQPLARICEQARAMILDAHDHQGLPFEMLVEALQPHRSLSHTPLFQVMFNFLREDYRALEMAFGRAVNIQRIDSAAQCELTLEVIEQADGRLQLEWIYAAELFEPDTIARMAWHYRQLLRALVDRVDAPLGDIALLSADEYLLQHSLSVNPASRSTCKSALEPIHRLFERQAQARPDATALIIGDVSLSYAELNRRANRLAHHLIAQGVRIETRVGIAVARSLDMVVGLLAILKAGGTYVPLDTDYPPERLAYQIEDSGIELLLLHGMSRQCVPVVAVRAIELDAVDLTPHLESNPAVAVHGDNLAYVIYTSGSTGKPKGAANRHAAVTNCLQWMQDTWPLHGGDGVLHKAPFGFDVAVWELFWPLIAGARLVLAEPGEQRDPARIIELIRRHDITTVNFVPAMLQVLLEEDGIAHAASLRHIICGGEAMTAVTQRAVQRLLPGATLQNLYGPTEAAIHVTRWSCEGEAPFNIPIGQPLTDTRAWVLDADLNPVPPGVAGELYLGGIALARGYLHRPGLSAAAFVADPLDSGGGRLYRTGDLARWNRAGQLEYLGRIDHQVKIRGCRIELGEIEAQLLALPDVREALVVARVQRGETSLVAYVGTSAAIDVAALRDALTAVLPDYMVPRAFVVLPSLPLNANGKLDRSALPEPVQDRADGYVAPRGDLETMLAAIWADVLGLERIGREDNFFDLGGHSLQLMRVRQAIEKSVGPLSIVDLFKYPRIGALAAWLQTREQRSVDSSDGTAATDNDDEHALRQRAARFTGHEIAIVGMAARLPGADDLDTFWNNIRDGVESIEQFSAAQLRAAGVDEALLNDPEYVRAGVRFDGFDQFDAGFFGYTPRDAENLDPQQRIFLECAWSALEHAGCDPQRPPGRIGIYAGDGPNLYLLRHLLPSVGLSAATNIADLLGLMSGNAPGSLATRTAYKLNLRGPALAVQTACSTSLTAVHMACQSLLGHDCDVALAGGVWLNLLQQGGYHYQAGAILSPDGHCRAFDARAAGTVIGSGAGVVVLKRLGDALAAGDCIHAVIKGSAANNDGSDKIGFTAPSVGGQARVIRAAQLIADVPASSIGYIEAHGTGTTLGDPIELAALTRAFLWEKEAETARRGFCAIGSVKTNIGHLDAAAGVAGLIKTVLALKHATLPPSLHFEKPNPEIDFANSPFFVNTQAQPWPSGATPRRAGVSSFGIGGTNVHVVLEEAPAPPSNVSGGWQVLPISAKNADALALGCQRLAADLQSHSDRSLADVAYTLQTGRQAFAWRHAVVAADDASACAQLQSPQTGQCFARVAAPEVVFLFPGGGAQHVEMGAALYRDNAFFRNEVDRCLELLLASTGIDLRACLFLDAGQSAAEKADAEAYLSRIDVAQPALFIIEYAFAKWWMQCGVRPVLMLGHSLGEYVAACIAGVFTLDDALRIVATRGQLMRSLAAGAMTAVSLPEAELMPYLAPGCDVAAINAADLCVLAGPAAAIGQVEMQLRADGHLPRRLHVSIASHSTLVEPIMQQLEHAIAAVPRRAPEIPFVSNVTGHVITADEACDPAYWSRHLRSAVRFADGLSEVFAVAGRVLLEVGPGETLTGFARQHGQRANAVGIFASQSHPQQAHRDAQQLAQAVAGLWCAGVDLDWSALHRGIERRKVALPTYAFQRQRYWVDASAMPATSEKAPAASEKKNRAENNSYFYTPVWRSAPLPSAENITLGGSSGCTLIFGGDDDLSAHLMDVARAHGERCVLVKRGEQFAQQDADRFVVNASARGDIEKLLRAVDAAQGVERIVHLWSRGDDERAEAIFECGFFSVQTLVQVLDALSRRQRLSLMIVTDRMEDVSGSETILPEKATLPALVKVAGQEYPWLHGRVIDAEPHARASDLAQRLWVELRNDQAVPFLVAYRGRNRWVRDYENLRADAPRTQRLRREGVYLITGGLGGVGLALARYLGKVWQARLVLAARTPLPSRAQWHQLIADADQPATLRRKLQQLLDLESAGVAVMTVAGDVGNPDQLAAMRASIHERFGAIHGVVHAVVHPERGMIAHRTRADVEAAFAPKIDGTRTLLTALCDEPLDFVVLCSSVASIIGGLGRGDYAAANGYLDAFAIAHRQTSSLPVFSVNWDAWRDVGIAVDMHIPAGIGLDENTGVLAFERVVNGPELPQVIVSAAPFGQRLGALDDWAGDIAKFETLPAPADVAEATPATHPRPHLSNPYVAADGPLQQDIAELWQRMLGISAIGVHDNLFELGGDSLLAIRLLTQVRRTYDVELHPADFFRSPTIADLSTAVEMRLLDEIEREAEESLTV